MIFKIVFFPSKPLIYQSSVRVDLVGLPDKVKPVVKKAQKAPEVKVPTKKKIAPKNKKSLKKKQSDSLKRLQAIQSIEDSLQKAEKKSGENQKQELVKGNIISEGTVLKGLQKLDYNEYISQIDTHIKNHWVLPEWLAQSPLKASILVKFDEDGYVILKTIVNSSGQKEYDNLVLEAIDRASPFPAPPHKFKNLVKIDGIIFRFPE